MGKQKSNPSSNIKNSNNQDDLEFPKFDEKALSALTSRIKDSLGKQKLYNEKSPTADAEKSIKKSNHKNQDQKKKTISHTPNPKAKAKTSDLNRGTKRDAAGNAKSSAESPAKNRDYSAQSRSLDDKVSNETLLEEILALGGTEEDLKLVENVDSEDDKVNQSTNPGDDESLRKELKAYAAGLGIHKVRDEDEQESSLDAADDQTWESSSEPEPQLKTKTKAAERPKTLPISSVSSQSDLPNRLIFEARSDWYDIPLPPLPTHQVENQAKFSQSVLSLKEHAISLLETDSQLYASMHLSASSSHRFLSTIMTSGTLSDKVSALTLVIQESPVHTTKSFESLLGLAKKRSRGQALTALAALKDLLGAGTVLPPERRLRNFVQQPGLLATLSEHSVNDWKPGQRLPGNISRLHLIYWAYEDWLKRSYFEMLKILESWCNDEVEYARSRVVTYVYELLRDKPEQEANLLRLLVNKLGDPDKKISSRASYLILQLQISHPLMKPIIIRSIETEVLLRPSQNTHAKYYAINTLNQTILSTKESDVAKTLIRIYFELFVSLLKRPEIIKPTSTSVSEQKVNRKGEVQGGGGPVGKKAKAKLTHLQESKLANEELNEKMVSAVLTGVNRAFPFLNSEDEDISLEDHMETLFKITHSSNFNTSVQALMLIEQLATSKNLSVDRFYRTLYESLLDPRLITSSKHALYLNLLYRSLRSDNDIKRIKAFAKRMMQIVTLHQPPFICGTLYLLKEMETKFPGLRSLRIEPEDDGGEEKFVDVPEEASSDAEKFNRESDQALQAAAKYNGRKRDPQYCNAHNSCLWELIPFLVHFHPSVSLFAKRLLDDENMPPKPDLASHTLSSFLDRFVYRNAKAASKEPRGSSIMQPLAGNENPGILISNKGIKHKHQPLNCEAFWRKKAEDVAVDEVFFHKYYSQIGKSKQNLKKKSKRDKKLDDTSDNDKDEIWEALVKSKPDIEGDDDDSDMPDIDDDYGSDSFQDDLEVDDEEDHEEDDTLEHIVDSRVIETDVSDVDAEIENLFERELMLNKPHASKDSTANNNKARRKKFKNLPTFASLEDYASVLDEDEDESYQ